MVEEGSGDEARNRPEPQGSSRGLLFHLQIRSWRGSHGSQGRNSGSGGGIVGREGPSTPPRGMADRELPFLKALFGEILLLRLASSGRPVAIDRFSHGGPGFSGNKERSDLPGEEIRTEKPLRGGSKGREKGE